MDVDKRTSFYGLIGCPVKHSFSPFMHNAAFGALGIPAEYRLFAIEPQRLEDFLLRDIRIKDTTGVTFSSQQIVGFNVTIPHKESVIKYLQRKSAEVEFTGAVNVVARENNGLGGWNTDGIGFERHLRSELEFDASERNIIILGAGGAAKAWHRCPQGGTGLPSAP